MLDFRVNSFRSCLMVRLRFLSILFLLFICFGKAQVDLSEVELKKTLGLGVLAGVTYSLDGKLLASYGGHGIILWNTSSGEIERTIENIGMVFSASFSPDGKLLASSGLDNIIKLWEVSSGDLIHFLEGHEYATSISFSPDGSLLASGGDDGIKLWEVSSGNLIRLLGENEYVISISFNPDGNLLASGGDDGIKLWEVSSGNLIRTFEGHDSDVTSVSFSADGSFLASGGRNEAKLWEVSSGNLIRTFEGHSDWINSVSFNPASDLLVSGSNDNTVKLWEVSSGVLIRTLEGHGNDVISVSFSPDGSFLASGSWNEAKLWEVNNYGLIHSFEGYSGSINSVNFSPDGNLLISGGQDQAKLWEVGSGNLIHTFKGHGNYVNYASFSPDSNLLALGGNDSTIKLWEVSSGKLLRTLEGHDSEVYSVNFSPDGHLLASGSLNEAKLWEVSSGDSIRSLEGITISVITSVNFSPDSSLLATTSGFFSSNSIKLWEVSSGDLIRTFEGHSDVVNSVSFHPNSDLLASGSNDNTVKLWEVNSGALIRTLEGHSDGVNSVSFSSDGSLLASGSGDHTINLWEVSSGDLLNTLEDITMVNVSSISFSPDGSLLTSGSLDGTIRFWGTEDSRAVFCQTCTTSPPTISVNYPYPNTQWKQPYLELILSVDHPQPEILDYRIEAAGQVLSQITVRDAVVVGVGHDVTLNAPLPAGLELGSFPVSVVATTPEGLESEPVTLNLVYSYVAPKKPDLYILAVGVDDYISQNIGGLSYAAKDAETISTLFASQENGLYDKVHSYVLTNDQATARGVRSTLGRIRNAVGEEDTVILFFSAHGINDKSYYYLILHDTESGNWEGTALPQRDLEDFVERVPGNVIVFIDTCHSGLPGRLPAVASDPNATEDPQVSINPESLVQSLARNAALDRVRFVFSASQGNEYAQESADWGHGAFTKAIVEGLSEEKARLFGNNDVTPANLFSYIDYRVQELTNEQQHPNLVGSGGGFVLWSFQ